MLKAWDQADIDVDLGYCRGTAVLRRVALKSEGSRRDAAGLRPMTPAKKPALRFCGEGATELQNCRNGFSAGGASCSDFECGARLRASPRGLVRARRLSPGTTRVRGGRYRHPSAAGSRTSRSPAVSTGLEALAVFLELVRPCLGRDVVIRPVYRVVAVTRRERSCPTASSAGIPTRRARRSLDRKRQARVPKNAWPARESASSPAFREIQHVPDRRGRRSSNGDSICLGS